MIASTSLISACSRAHGPCPPKCLRAAGTRISSGLMASSRGTSTRSRASRAESVMPKTARIITSRVIRWQLSSSRTVEPTCQPCTSRATIDSMSVT
jgi:hypothetical protein